MAKKPRENRVPIMMSDEELAAVDDWRFENRIATRSDAIRRLVQIGLVTEEELEQIVDSATNCVDGIANQLRDVIDERGAITPLYAPDVLFQRDEVEEIISAASSRALEALNAVEGLHHIIVTVYNAIAPLADAKSIAMGIRESAERIEEANAATERVKEKRIELEENRYIAIIYRNDSAEQKEEYNKLPEDEKDEYLLRRFAEMAAEEAADPEAFADRYGLKPFWERPEWRTILLDRQKVAEEAAEANSQSENEN